MFPTRIYVQRRAVLKSKFQSGLLLFLGNEESPMNYGANTFAFRQDSTFLYYWGLDLPSLAAVLDIDSGREMLFGNDPTVDEIVWTGPQTLLEDNAEKVGVASTYEMNKLPGLIAEAMQHGRRIHYIRQYRADNIIKISDWMGMTPAKVNPSASVELTKAVIEQRSVKAKEEIAEIEIGVNITREMQLAAMKHTKPGMLEREIAGLMHGITLARGGDLSFPIIFSIHGETLHNHHHHNKMKRGDLVVNDCGAESALHYAGDLTRTFPVSGKFTTKQKEIYEIVLKAQKTAISMIAPGVKFKEVHLTAAGVMFDGLKELGLMKGDTAEAVKAGAHAIFFQCGTGHMMGLDVHDMENLGEEFIGYDADVQRSEQFGLCYLRMAKPLQPGFVVTVEPGIYFIPELFNLWKAEKKHESFINYDKLAGYMNFGGVRIEDDVLVIPKGHRVLGKKLAKSVAEVEAACGR